MNQENIFIDPADYLGEVPEVFDDFDLDISDSETWRRAVENSENLAAFTKKTEIHFIHQPRPGKKLLVLDLDHTLLDFSGHNAAVLNIASMKRPHMGT